MRSSRTSGERRPDFVGPRHELRERLLLRRAAPRRAPGPRVLDAGAGQGIVLGAGSPLAGFDVTSTDASPAAVAVLARAGSAARSPRPTRPQLPVPGGVVRRRRARRGARARRGRPRRAARGRARPAPGRRRSPSRFPRNPALYGPSDEWAGHVRRYTREGLIATVAGRRARASSAASPGGSPSPRSTIGTSMNGTSTGAGPPRPGGWRRHAVPVLGAVLQLDRLFVGVERGSLGYLLVAPQALALAPLGGDRRLHGRLRRALDPPRPRAEHRALRPREHGAGGLGDRPRPSAADHRPARRPDLAARRAHRRDPRPLRAAVARSGRAPSMLLTARRPRSRSARCPSTASPRRHLGSAARRGSASRSPTCSTRRSSGSTLNEFHPVALATPLLLFAFEALDRDRLGLFAVYAASR